jgi:hypothetical protein
MTVPKNYPLPFDPDDRRLDDEVVALVAELLQFKGFPFVQDGPDFDRLRDALHRFVYADGGR